MRRRPSLCARWPSRSAFHRTRARCVVAALVASAGWLTAEPVQAQDSSVEGRATSGKVPNHAFWVGVRAGLFVPYGGLYADHALVTTPFQDVATAGPSLELDVGARFMRRFIGYAFVDQAFLGRGNSAAWTEPHGGQSRAATQSLGLGLRWESNPDTWGIVADVAAGYRWFTAEWENATSVRMGGLGDVRVGLGATIRVAPNLLLAPMASVFTGGFTDRTLNGAPLGSEMSTYVASALTLSGHFDVY